MDGQGIPKAMFVSHTSWENHFHRKSELPGQDLQDNQNWQGYITDSSNNTPPPSIKLFGFTWTLEMLYFKWFLFFELQASKYNLCWSVGWNYSNLVLIDFPIPFTTLILTCVLNKEKQPHRMMLPSQRFISGLSAHLVKSLFGFVQHSKYAECA